MKSRISLYLCRRNVYPLTALLLSFSLITMPFVQITLASSGAQRQVGSHSSGLRKTIATEKQSYRANSNAAVPAPAPEPLLVPSITATKVDALIGDDGDNKADPGGAEKIEYTITITNNGTDASSVVFTDDIDDHTTLVPGSINTQPIADPDTYTASGNIGISIAAPGVLANDRDPDTGNATGLTVTKVQGVGANVGVATDTAATGRGGVKGKVTLNANGGFSYEPAPGFVGDDTFTYEISDGTKIDTATVNITISGMVWFISNNAGGSNLGTFTNPFTSLASFNTANAATGVAPDPKNGDFVSLRTGTGSYNETDGINLRAQQKLIGNAIQFNTVFTADANSVAAYTTFAGSPGSAPTITTTGGNGVDLSTDNTVRGFNVGNVGGSFFKINGTAVGNLVLNTLSATGSGAALNVSTSGAFGSNVTFTALESTSAAAGLANINLVNVSGILAATAGGTGLTNTGAGAIVNISGGSVNFSYPASVSRTSGAGTLLTVSGGHTGTLTFVSTSASAGAGLAFDNADGSYSFNTAFSLTGGTAGISIINGSSGTFNWAAVATITGIAGVPLNVGTSPGTPNVTYSGTITHNNPGTRAVNIDGTTGGSIAINSVTAGSTAGGVSNTGININNANGSVTFTTLALGTAATRMTQQAVTIAGGTGTYALGTVNIFTSNVTGIGATNADGTVNNTNGNVDTNGGTTVNVDGPAALTTLGMTFTKLLSDGGTSTGLIIQDTNGSFTVTGSGSACTSSATCTGGSLSGKTGTGLGGSGTDGVFIRNAVNISLTRMNLSDNNGNGLFAGSVNGIRIDNCFINSNADALTGADYLTLGFNNEANVHLVNVSGTSLAGANPTAITNSTITNAFEHDVEIDQTTGTLTDFQINNSTINNNGASGQANNRVLYIMNGGPGVTGTLTVQDSTLTGNRTVGALTAAGIQATVSAGTQTVKVFRNTLLNHNVAVDVSTSTSGVLNFDISNNGGSGGVANNGVSNGRIVGSDSVAVSVFTNANSTGSVNGFIQGNTIGTQGVVASGSVNGRGIQFQNEGAVASTVLISGNIVQGVAGNQELNIQHGIAVAGAAERSDVTAINNTLRENTNTTRPFNAEILNTGTLCVDISGNTFANNVGQGGSASLLRVNDPAGTGTMLVRQLNPSAAANANELDDANGLSFAAGQVTVSGAPTFNGGACTQPTALAPVTFDSSAVNVAPQTVEPKIEQRPATAGVQPASSANVQLNAGNKTPRIESAPATSISVAQPSEVRMQSVAANTGRQKLEAKPAKTRNKANSHHPTFNRTRNNAAAAAVPVTMSGETVSVNIGTLRANDSVTITFQVTVDNPPNLTLLNPPRVRNQGSVAYNDGVTPQTPVLTDDPSVGVAIPADPTDTPVDLFDTSTTLVSDLNPSNFGDTVTFTATVAETPAQAGADPGGTVDFIDTSNGNAVVCDDVALTGGSAQCQTSTLTAGTHNIRADYSGDGNFDPSQSNIVAQVVNACTQDPIVTSTADGGAGSLREALANVCSSDTITFNLAGAGPHTITLTTGELLVGKNVTINNNSGESITVSGNNLSRVFNIDTGKTAAIIGLTISGGNTTGDGGGIINNGALTVVNSTLSGNVAGADGGAISTTATGTSLTLINTTISGNSAGGSGGGVIVLGGTATSVNSTITNNTADSDNNAAGSGGGIRAHAGTTTLKNTIVAGNFNEDGASDAADDISGTVDAASSFNLIGAGGAGTLIDGVNNNQVGVANAGLGALANNGGTTQTHALLPTSTAVEAGGNANLPADVFDLDGDANVAETLPVDQRGTGFPRTADSQDANTTQTVDIGAFELHPSIEDIPNQTTAEDTPKMVTFNLGDDTGSLISTVTATSSNTALVSSDGAHLSFTGSGGSRTLTITPNTDANSLADGGTTTITVTVTATNGRTAVDTFDLTVTEVNDAPTAVDDTLTAIDEDSGVRIIPFADLLANDLKGPANESSQTLTITNVSNPVGGTVAINGTNVEFTPTANFSGPASFDYTVTDNGTTNGVSDPKSDTGSVSFTINAINDPPSFVKGADQTVNEDAGPQTVVGWATSISAGPNEVQTLTFNVSVTGTTGNLAFSSAPAINATTGTLTYTTAADTNGTATVSVTLSDNGSNTPPNSNTSAAQTFTITVNAVNDAPTFQLGANPSVNENAGPQTINGFAFNFQPGPVTATDESGQTLVGYTVTQTGSTGGLTFSAVPAINTAGTLTFTATGGSSGTATFDVVATDSGSGTPPNVNQSAPVSFTISVNAVNDAPVNTVPGPQGTNQNTPLTFSSGNGNQISVADSDAGTNAIQVTLTATNGTITLSGTSGLSFSFTDANGTGTGDGTADATMTFRGTLTNINAALNGMTFTPTLGFSGAASLTITSNDLGNTGSGGPLTDTDVVNIQVSTNVSIQDAQVAEPASGSVNMIFTVTLSAPAPAGGASVNFATQNQPLAISHAQAPGDYTATSGTVNFAAGEQFKTIQVEIKSDSNNSETNETFLVNLSSPVNATIADGQAVGTILIANQAGAILITELRTSGPAGAGDDFVEVYNNSNSPHTVTASDASAGYGVFKMGATCSAAPILIGVIPNGTVIPARGHYLLVGSQYSLGAYGAGNLTMSSDIENDRNVGIFKTSVLGNISSATRLDAIGFGANTGGSCDLLREGTTLTPLVGSVLEYSYVRDECGKKGNPATFGPCPTGGATKDSNDNAEDMIFVETTGAVTVAGQRLGAPGPQGLGSPRKNDDIFTLLLDATKGANGQPNRERNNSISVPNGSTGTLTIRRRFVNTTGAPVTQLRFRIVDISALTAGGGNADLRALSSTSVVISGIADSQTCLASTGSAATPCTITVQGTTLETPPNQPLGGALNSSWNAGTVTLGTPLAPGASINLQLVLGVEKSGAFKFFFNVEALP